MTALIVGVACLFSTLLIYSGTVISFLRFEHTLLFVGTFAETTLLAATLFGALFLGLSLAGKRLPSMLLGAGGGMLLLPLLHRLTDLREHEAFACSVCTMLPLSVVSLVVYWLRGGEFLTAALPYLAGGALGGIAAGLLLRRLSAVWLHRALGALIVWGGLRLLLR